MHVRKAILLVALATCLACAPARAGEFEFVPAAPSPLGAPAVPAPAPDAGRFWIEPDLLIAFLSGSQVPVLVTASTPGTPRSAAGVEGAATTRTLFGDHVVNDDPRLGLRLRACYRFGGGSREGVEASLLWLDRQGDSFLGRSDGGQILARPFYNLQTGLNDSELIAYPGVQSGEVRVRTASDLLGAEINYRRALSCSDYGGDCCAFDLLIGYRGLRYRDKVTIDEAVRPFGTPPATSRVAVRDAFYALDVFNGLQVGLAGRLQLDHLFIDGRATAGLGATRSSTDVAGSTALVLPNGTVTRSPVGLLASRGNAGGSDDVDVAFVGGFDLRAGYQFNQRLSASIGYTSLYLSSVKRAGRLIDQGVNPAQLPSNAAGTPGGPARPALLGGDSDLWARGLSLGVELRY